MAPKVKSSKLVTAQMKSSITTRRGRLLAKANEVKKVEIKPTSNEPPTPKNKMPIKKFKLNTENKPKKGVEATMEVDGGGGGDERKTKKIHKCSICGKVFKGVQKIICVCFFC